MIRCTAAHVDLAAVRANYRALVDYVAQDVALGAAAGQGSGRVPQVIAVLKANAYGHGATAVGQVLSNEGASWLAVADIEEGIELREAGIPGRILVFGALSVSDLEGLFTHDLTPTISSPGAARALIAAASSHGRPLCCHLKIDTGLHRLGFRDDNLGRTLPEVLESPWLDVEAVFTHFATAEDAEQDLFDTQRVRFARAQQTVAAIDGRPRLAHAANSAACLRDSRTWGDLIRPGLLLYGVVPPPLASTIALTPAMTLSSRIVAVKGVRTGEPVGYGARFVATEPRTLAIVPAGYADGLDRRLEGRGAALVRGQRAPIVGAVSMDMLTIDVSDIDGAAPGDEVVFLGSQGPAASQTIDAREMADWIGTVPYEVLSRLGSRVVRHYA